MENLNSNLDSEAVVNDGIESRKRVLSSDSDSDSDSTSSGQPRRRRARTSQTVSYAQFEFLSQQVEFLINLMSRSTDKEATNVSTLNNTSSIASELNLRRPVNNNESSQLNILSDVSTVVKDPIFPPSNDKFLSKLTELQRFKRNDWNAIRFSDTQKKYLTTPGFVELNVNDELKRFESAMLKDDSRSYLLERSFAGLTNALLCQKDELHKTLQSLVDWAISSGETLTPNTLFDKVESLFSKDSAYSRVTEDLLQIVCGRRADLINIRREGLLRQISESFHRDILHKIPPSTETLFDEEAVQTYLQKIGGVDKLATTSKLVPQSYSKESFYQNQKPSTSKQADDRNFRRDTTTKKQKSHSNQNKRKTDDHRAKPRGIKTQSRSSFKNKRRE